MANPEFQEGQQDSFVDESEYFGAFYERDENVITTKNKENVTQIVDENPHKKGIGNNSTKLCKGKRTVSNRNDAKEQNTELHHVPSTPPQNTSHLGAGTPDEAKVPSTISESHENVQQPQNHSKYTKQMPKTCRKDLKSEKTFTKYDESKEKTEKYKSSSTLAKDGFDNGNGLWSSTGRDGSCGDINVETSMIGGNESGCGNDIELHLLTKELHGGNNDGDELNSNLQGDEESCNLTMLENLQSLMVMQRFNEKYSQHYVSTFASSETTTNYPNKHARTVTTERESCEVSKSNYLSKISQKSINEENDAKRSREETHCILQTNLLGKQEDAAANTVVSGESQDVNQKNTHSENTNDQEHTSVIVHSRIPNKITSPSMGSNITASMNPCSNNVIDNILMSDGTLSYLTAASGQMYANDLRTTQSSGLSSSMPMSYSPGSMGIFSVPYIGCIPYIMMLMSGGISTGLSLPAYSSVYPLYVQTTRPSLQHHMDKNTSQMCTQQQQLITTSSYPYTHSSSTSSNGTYFLPSLPSSQSVFTNINTWNTLSNTGALNPSLSFAICNTSTSTAVESSSSDSKQSCRESQISNLSDNPACLNASSVRVAIAQSILTTPGVFSSSSSSSSDSDIAPPTILSVAPSSNTYDTSSDNVPSSSCVDSSRLSTSVSTKPSAIACFERVAVLNNDSPHSQPLPSEHTFKTPKRIASNQGNNSKLSLQSPQKKSTMIRVSPRYSDTNGCSSPLVLVSKNVAPLQRIGGQSQQFVITQGHDRRVLKERTDSQANCNERKGKTKQPIYLKGTPPQGYKRRLLSRSGSKRRSKTRVPAREQMSRKFVLFEEVGQPPKDNVDVITKNDSRSPTDCIPDVHLDPKIDNPDRVDTMATEVLQEITEVLNESRDVASAQTSSPSARPNQTTLSECLRELLSSCTDTTATIDFNSTPGTTKTPKRRKNAKKSSKEMSTEFRTPKTPKHENKKRKREREHRNCVELRECMQKLSRMVPGTHRSWSRLQVISHALDYIEKTIKKLEGFGVSRFDICKGASFPLSNQITTSDNKENEQEAGPDSANQIVAQQLAKATSSAKRECLQPAHKYTYSGPLRNISELVITTENETNERWINLSDITKMLSDSGQVPLDDSSDVPPMVENANAMGESSVYLVEVTDDSTFLRPVECTSIIDQALTLSNIKQSDQLSVDAGEQCCPSVDNSSDIHECCEGLLALHSQQVPDSPSQSDTDHQLDVNLNCTNLPYGYNNLSSLESSPVISQRKNTDHLVNSPRLTELLASPVVVVPQDTYSTEDHRLPETNMTGMSPFIVPSSPDVSKCLRGISNPIATEEFSQSSNSQDDIDNGCTPCGVVSDDPLSYVSPFTTPRLGFSPTFDELSPGRIVLDNESYQQESPIQRAPITTVCSVTDFSEVGLTSVAASVEISSSIDEYQATRPKRKYRKRQSKAQSVSANESPINQKKPRNYHPKTPRDSGTKNKAGKSSNKTSKSCKKQTPQDDVQTETALPKPTHDLQQDSFKTPSPRIRKDKLKRAATPETVIPRKQIKAKKEPKQKKSVCKRQLIDP